MRTDLELKQKMAWIENVENNFSNFREKRGRLCHYTSLPVLFSILETDSFWVSGTRFSNDSSEEILLNNEAFFDMNYRGDSFILCFSDKEDCLSQWRGYCFNGGAAIEFDLKAPHNYSILHADNETSQKYELDHNAPFPVVYVDQSLLSPKSTSLSDHLCDCSPSFAPWEASDIIPYLKNCAFEEESEWRLMFSNHRGELSKCVRFRTLHDGVKVPYMVVKVGDVGKKFSSSDFDVSEYKDGKKFDLMREKGITSILIPQGNNQESIYYQMESIVAKHNKSNKEKYPIRVYCDGHLPIKRIIVAPTYDRERVAEKIKRYCWSNYWLRNVEVTYSSIPYIPPSE